MAAKEYISILEQALEKKIRILNEIFAKCDQQKMMLLDENLSADEFNKNVQEKGVLIEELTKLDTGFEQVYGRIRDEVMTHQEEYAEDIKRLQGLISEIMGKSTSIQAEEARNKELAQKKFTTVKKQIKEVKSSQKVVNQYYQNMMKMNYIDPQFMDNKK